MASSLENPEDNILHGAKKPVDEQQKLKEIKEMQAGISQNKARLERSDSQTSAQKLSGKLSFRETISPPKNAKLAIEIPETEYEVDASQNKETEDLEF